MSNLFSGLEEYGLTGLEKMDVYAQESKTKLISNLQKRVVVKMREEELVFDKTYKCPACDAEFKSKVVKTGKAKLIQTDSDLRPKYDHVDSLKYDAVLCPECGYAALGRFFQYLSSAQIKYVRENITSKFHNQKFEGSYYTYDEAIKRHKLALLSSMVKNAKTSEKAYTCLKIAWLYRGKRENLSNDTKNYENEIKKLQASEDEFLMKAYEGFNGAFSKEDFPMCGMDEYTVMYIVSDLAFRAGKLDEAMRMLSHLLSGRGANDRVKNKARELKEEIKKAQEANQE
ncbi:protein of unknown function DUF2225 [Lachnospiraceae bacterium KM106-2]|nr:protein of unknown function DUF2225 [Lachnospiraceae bacterium KM106-2]